MIIVSLVRQLHEDPIMNAKRSIAGFRAWETRRERDEFAAQSIPSDLLPLWDRTKLQFRGTPETRVEAFMQYAHDAGDGEAIDAVQDEADRKLAAMIREYEARADRAA